VKTIDITMVRVYLMESEHLMNKVIHYLKTEAKLRGVSVFRAISGFGESGEHTASLLDLSLDLPLTIEFFDTKEKIKPALEYLSQTIKHGHVVFWEAKTSVEG